MAEIKQMPYEEKYAKVADNVKLDETFILPLVQNRLGDNAVAELKGLWDEGVKPVPEGASSGEKYEIAYGNWIWMAKSAYGYIRERMGEEGIKEFDEAEVRALKRKNAGPALYMLGLVRIFSTSSAFSMITKQLAYQLQWVSPFSVTELSRDRAVINFPKCKILDYPGTEDLCHIGCQSTYPRWMAEQFKIKMEFERQDNGSCIGVITPVV